MIMLIKYALIFCLFVVAVLLVFYTFNEKETIMAAKNAPSPVDAKRSSIRSVGVRANDDIAAAILIFPKSFLPALRRFSQSRMAQGIKVLPAQIQLKEGKMFAVYNNLNESQRKPLIATDDNFSEKITISGAGSTRGKMEGIAAISFLYLLANVHKNRLYR